MKQILFFLILISSLPGILLAEIYECNGVYQTSPCKDGSGPLKNLPKISRSEGQSLADIRREIVKLKGKSESLRSSLDHLNSCEQVTSGLPYRVIKKKLYLGDKTVTFDGAIRNYGTSPIEAPIAAGLLEEQSKNHSEREIATKLAPGEYRDFSIQMPVPMAANAQYRITIGQTMAQHCISLPLSVELLPPQLPEQQQLERAQSLLQKAQTQYSSKSRTSYDREFSMVCYKYATLPRDTRTVCGKINAILEQSPTS